MRVELAILLRCRPAELDELDDADLATLADALDEAGR
jgi:hypothetical protein